MKKVIHIFFVALFLLLSSGESFGWEEKFYLIAETQYFSIYGSEDLNIEKLLQKINFNPLVNADALLDSEPEDVEGIFARTMDALYLEISDILGINIYSYHGDIHFVPDQNAVSDIIRHYSGTSYEEPSFYLHSENAIYVSYEDLTTGMLGHEIAHAIISHYFVVPPSAKVQEVLSGYVEYNLRKSAGTLPKMRK